MMHHQRRRSGHGLSTNSSATDVRKAVIATDPSAKNRRPGMTRRQTPVNAQKLGRSQRERERAWQETWDDERESFPQYCMTCEKQFVPRDDMFLYCSDTCRRIDHDSSSPGVSVRNYNVGSYSLSAVINSVGEPKDIVPRASPSRPGSMLLSNSPPASPNTTAPDHPYHNTPAVSALRSLSLRPPSPPSPTGNGGSIWPFGRSGATSSLGNSYHRPSASFFSSTYDGAYTYNSAASSANQHQPLPSRNHSGSSRPRSIDLLTPMVGR